MIIVFIFHGSSCKSVNDKRESERTYLTSVIEEIAVSIVTVTLHKKMKFSMKDCFSKCDQIRRFPRIWSHLLKKPLIRNFIFCAV